MQTRTDQERVMGFMHAIHATCEEYAAAVLQQNYELQVHVLSEKNAKHDTLKAENERLKTERDELLKRLEVVDEKLDTIQERVVAIIAERDALAARLERPWIIVDDRLPDHLQQVLFC